MGRVVGVSCSNMCNGYHKLVDGIKKKTRFEHCMIEAGNDKTGGEIPRKALEIKQRFMGAV